MDYISYIYAIRLLLSKLMYDSFIEGWKVASISTNRYSILNLPLFSRIQSNFLKTNETFYLINLKKTFFYKVVYCS